MAKELARHSDVKMTMRYTHIGIGDQARAVANLPLLKPEPNESPADRKPALQMRCIPGGVERQAVSSSGTADQEHKRKNPCYSKGISKKCHRLAFNDKAEDMGFEPTAFKAPMHRSRLEWTVAKCS